MFLDIIQDYIALYSLKNSRHLAQKSLYSLNMVTIYIKTWKFNENLKPQTIMKMKISQGYSYLCIIDFTKSMIL